MKKLILAVTMAFISLCSNIATASNHKIDIVDISNNELVFILDRTANNTFTEYFVFQYEASDFSFLSQKSSFSLVGYTSSSITILCDNEQITFTSGFGENTSTHFFGYGLSKRNGTYSLISPLPAEGDIFDVVTRPTTSAIGGGGTPKKITCHSGGPGSTSCSAESGSLGGGGSCSVTCSSGYYACCDDTKNECKCVKSVGGGSSGAVVGEATLNIATIRGYFTH